MNGFYRQPRRHPAPASEPGRGTQRPSAVRPAQESRWSLPPVDTSGRSAERIQRAAPVRVALRSSDTVVHRTIDTAAAALFATGTIRISASQFKGKFLKDHEVTSKDLAAVQVALDGLRAARAPAAAAAVVDVRNPADRPTSGGMTEGDAAAIAGDNEWTVDNRSWTCSDRGHTPKGRLYTNGDSFYGADNTGHVGWGFKVWTKKDKTTLDYAGNLVWSGTAWVHRARGT